MGSLSHLESDFFKQNVKTDFSKDAEYGIVPLEMDSQMTDIVLKEAMNYGKEIKSKTSLKTDFRKVQAWRLNQKDSVTAELISHSVIELNQVFNYRLSGIQDLQYLEYHADDNAKYDWHIDAGDSLSSMRKISISWVLNEGFEGGNLEFFGDGGEIVTFNSTPNKLVSFTSFLNHRVTPVTSGIRKVLVCWIYGEQWR
jgi:PKHD-type hydroxylase